MRIVDLGLDLTHENARDFGLNNFYHSQITHMHPKSLNYCLCPQDRRHCYCSNVLADTSHDIDECMSTGCRGDNKGICGSTSRATFYDTSKADLSHCAPRK